MNYGLGEWFGRHRFFLWLLDKRGSHLFFSSACSIANRPLLLQQIEKSLTSAEFGVRKQEAEPIAERQHRRGWEDFGRIEGKQRVMAREWPFFFSAAALFLSLRCTINR
jgi:hypothetical protein